MSDPQFQSIFIHVQNAVNRLLDVDRFYVVVLDCVRGQLSFPYVWRNGSDIQTGRPPWTNRDIDEERWWLDRVMKQGLDKSQNGGTKYWPPGEPEPKSWLAVPVTIDDQTTLGLVVENWEIQDAYGENAQRILETIAKQSALSLRNAQLVQEWQESEKKRRAAERFMAVNMVAGEFAHSMNNVVGTIPVWIKLARKNLDVKDRKQADVLKYLDQIEVATRRLLEKAREVKEATQQRARERIEVNALVDNAIKRAIASQPNAGERILVQKELEEGLPKIEVERDSFIDSLTSIVRNGLEAMPQQGTLSVSTHHIQKTGTPLIEIVVSDSGIGMSEEIQKRIFEPFFTTKETGMGFGLWRDKTIIEELGGKIEVNSQPMKGTTFRIQLPAE